MKVLILGVNGFIGSHLVEAILNETDWQIDGMDLSDDKIKHINDERFRFTQGDIIKEEKWVQEQISQCDVVFPLVAIATPALYVQDPLRVFELDFEANLKVIRECVKENTRIIFPSTSEVYGMCNETPFDEEKSSLVTGPIHKERWIYSSSKQLLDRVIYAYGKHHNLPYTLFRPFNWYGPRQDNIFNPKPGSSRVLSQFIGNILRGESIHLVNGGAQKRCFTYIDDGIAALIRIIKNTNNAAHQQIFNVGNPHENLSIRTLAETLISLIKTHYPAYREKAEAVSLIDIDANRYYGEGYQDVELRVPAIHRANELLAWQPTVSLTDGLKATLDYYLT
jgi:nucleoside-diphosphate-sugar epimerase